MGFLWGMGGVPAGTTAVVVTGTTVVVVASLTIVVAVVNTTLTAVVIMIAMVGAVMVAMAGAVMVAENHKYQRVLTLLKKLRFLTVNQPIRGGVEKS